MVGDDGSEVVGMPHGSFLWGDYVSRDNFVRFKLERFGNVGHVYNVYRGAIGSSFLMARECGQVIL